MVYIDVPRNALRRYLADGTTPNPNYSEPVAELVLRAAVPGQAMRRIELDSDEDDVRPKDLNEVLKIGGEVYDFPVWIEVADADYTTQDVPGYLPRSTDAVGTPYKWAEWKDDNHTHHNYGGQWYIGGNSATGAELVGTVIKQLKVDGFSVLTRSQFQAIIEANS